MNVNTSNTNPTYPFTPWPPAPAPAPVPINMASSVPTPSSSNHEHDSIDDHPAHRNSLPHQPSAQGNGEPRPKRKRPVLSCLECKVRKTKCDKALPCSTCVGRGEPQACHYDDGTVPLQTYADKEEFDSLRRRVEELEKIISTGTGIIGAGERSGTGVNGSKDEPRAPKEVEAALTALEWGPDATKETKKQPIGVGMTRDREWPSIVNQSLGAKRPRWLAQMRDLITALPSRSMVEGLVDYYFTEFMIATHLHEWVFRQELAQLWPMIESGHYTSIDPAWLALLCAVLNCTAFSMLDDVTRCPFPTTRDGLESIADDLWEGMQLALGCADCMLRPQMRNLMAILVCQSFPSGASHPRISSRKDDMSVTRNCWHDLSVGMVKGLQLHRLGSDPTIMPPDDPMYPPGPSNYRRQMACRAFAFVLLSDTFMNYLWSGGHQPLFAFPPGSHDTAQPLNFTDQELLLPYGTPRPPTEPTECIFLIHMPRVFLTFQKIIKLHGSDVPYEEVLQVDRELRQSQEELLTMKLNHDLNENQTVAFFLTNSSYMARGIRLHRSFFLRSYEDERYMYSQRTVLSWARQTMAGHQILLTKYANKPVVLSSHFIIFHNLSSAIILFIHALHHPELREEVKKELEGSRKLFCSRKSEYMGIFSHRLVAAIRTVTAMLEVLEAPSELLDPAKHVAETLRAVQSEAARASAMDTEVCPVPSKDPAEIMQKFPMLNGTMQSLTGFGGTGGTGFGGMGLGGAIGGTGMTNGAGVGSTVTDMTLDPTAWLENLGGTEQTGEMDGLSDQWDSMMSYFF